MAGRFPGARDLDAVLAQPPRRRGVRSASSATRSCPPPAWTRACCATPGYVRRGGVLEDAELFDAGLLRHHARARRRSSIPQQRFFLECAWEALEDAGYDPERATRAGRRVRRRQPQHLPAAEPARQRARRRCGGLPASLAQRHGLPDHARVLQAEPEGPSVDVQTACSTSLVAVHLACQSLLAGECDMALAGGVSLTVPAGGAATSTRRAASLSPDGHCRAFDARAAGTVGGNGVGIVVLKRLADALADGDTIRAVIRGSAINNDGSGKVGFTAPSVDGQAEVIVRGALALAEVEPGHDRLRRGARHRHAAWAIRSRSPR